MNYNDLSVNIKNFNIQELKHLLKECNDGIISEQKYECIKLLISEYEYRRLSEYIKNTVDLRMLIKYNYDIIWKIGNDEVRKSIEFFNKNKIPFDGLLRWIPICLSIDRVYFIYNKLKNNKFNNDEIFKVLMSDIRLNLDDVIDIKEMKYSKDKEFVKFIKEQFILLNDKRKETDVYKRMMKEIILENNYALSHLK